MESTSRYRLRDRQVRHPIFARAFHRITPLMEREIGPRRDELLAGLSGHVFEVGAGSGATFAHYPDTVSEVIAFEPESYLRRNAAQVAASADVPVQVRDGIAEDIPLEDESADAAVVSVVLCTVNDPRRAAAELRRVLKPGGELRFLEHVRSANARKARLQRSLDRPRLWPRLAGGCHCGRDTLATLQAAGLRIERAAEQFQAATPSPPHAPQWKAAPLSPLAHSRSLEPARVMIERALVAAASSVRIVVLVRALRDAAVRSGFA